MVKQNPTQRTEVWEKSIFFLFWYIDTKTHKIVENKSSYAGNSVQAITDISFIEL